MNDINRNFPGIAEVLKEIGNPAAGLSKESKDTLERMADRFCRLMYQGQAEDSRNMDVDDGCLTEESEIVRNLIRSLHCDSLTGALNSRAINIFHKMLERGEADSNTGVIVIDFDNFRSYNESHSRSSGDMALKRCAGAIAGALSEKNFLFRYAGDEFLVFVPDCEDMQLLHQATAICSAVWNENIPREDVFAYDRITVTVGCCVIPVSEFSSEDYVSHAAVAVGIGKNREKNCVVYDNKIYQDGVLVSSYEEERKSILIVDDSEFQRELTKDFLEDDYDTIEASNGLEAIEIMKEKLSMISAVLLDIHMPVMDGFGVLEHMSQNGWNNYVPVLIVSDETSTQDQAKCLNYQIFDFVSKQLGEDVLKLRVRNALERFRVSEFMKKELQNKTDKMLEQNRRLAETTRRITKMLGSVVEARNMESGEHIIRVQTFTEILAQELKETHPELGLTDYIVEEIASASPLHDVGKIMISDAVLLKPGRLTPEEFELMKRHTTLGCELLEQNKEGWDEDYYRYCYDICRSHHERWDGRGYPEGLVGDNIPLPAQIVAIADCYDALVTERVYKKAFSPDEAYNMIMNGECGAFSDMMLEAFTGCREKFRKRVMKSREAGKK